MKAKLILLIISICWLLPGIANSQTGAGDIVLYASEAPVKVGNWQVVSDASAAGGARLANTNLGAGKITTALANPVNYFEVSFQAEANTPYRLWLRSKAESNAWANDSVFVQFSGSVTQTGAQIYRIGTTSATEVNLEDCSGCGISGWGWQDNGWGVGVLGPLVYFQTTGPQTLRVQVREDGLSIDQIVLSPATYITNPPGGLKNDLIILPKTNLNLPPQVNVSATPTTGTAPLAVNFTASASDSDGSIASYSWNFGNGQTSTLASPSITYQSAGNYTATLTVTDNDGATASDSVTINVSANQAPQVSFSATPTSGTAPLAVNFTPNASDPDGSIASYNWTFGNGQSATTSSASTTYSVAGSYTARLTVTDNRGATASASVVITVTAAATNKPPTVNASATPTSGTAPLAVNFSATASDPDGSIASYRWTFGNGQTATTAAAATTYSAAGTYTATLTVTDNKGATASDSVVITVAAPSTSVQLKVLSWNVAFGKGTDNLVNWDRTATYIANLSPDVMTLCEMPPSQIQNLVSLLQQKTGRTWYSHFYAKYAGYGEGNLILSRYPFLSTGGKYLSYQRSVAQAAIKVNNRTINLFTTHLDTSSGGRTTEVNELKAFAAGFAGAHIFGGDFNAGPDLGEMVLMAGTYNDSWEVARAAGTASAYADNPVGLHTRTRRGRIDYLWYSKSLSYLVLKAAQIPDSRDLNNKNVVIYLGNADDKGVRPSDHNRVVAIFDVK